MVTISGSVLLSCPRCWGMKMRTILSGKNILNRITSSSQPFRSSAGGNKSTEKSGGGSDDGSSYSLSLYDEQYKALNNLDFMTAAKILFTDPPKMKKFGLDFHLVQFFFVCLPSLVRCFFLTGDSWIMFGTRAKETSRVRPNQTHPTWFERQGFGRKRSTLK
ncbi:uncharacterized protein [Primulina huaijiensis]|uniref:uncharacterized protein n=1 Tax=Primulina huaijiensis TaxID=1492673 RepID=UPI003CC7914B